MIEPALSDGLFLCDVASARNDNVHPHLWWVGQSGFLVQWLGRHILIDPYLSDSLTKKYANTERPHVRMSRRVVDPASLIFIDLVISSHEHTDHLDPETLIPLNKVNFDLRLLAPRAVLRTAEQRFGGELHYPMDEGQTVWLDEIPIHAVPAAHETLDRDKRGSLRYLGYTFRFGNCTLYHSGDTVRYDEMVERLGPSQIDIAILPINGKLGNMDGVSAARLAKDIGAKIVIPCHYDMFEFNTASPDEFVAECERIGQRYRVLKLGERFTYPEAV